MSRGWRGGAASGRLDGVRVLIVGWSSPLHGEATAGDVLAMEAVARRLTADGIGHDTAWSAVMCPPGGLRLDDVDPARYTHVVFVCGPASGDAAVEMLDRFPRCRRIAVGVSVVDHADPLLDRLDAVIARDAPGSTARPDLAAHVPPPAVPVVGVYLTGGQQEYGDRRRHEAVIGALTDWLGGLDAALLSLETRLDPRDWRLPSTPGQVSSVIARMDAVVTMRMHGLVLALQAGVPALAIDPISGGGKVSAQAAAWDWPAVVGADDLGAGAPGADAFTADGLGAPGPGETVLDHWWRWCLSLDGRATASRRADDRPSDGMLDDLMKALRSR